MSSPQGPPTPEQMKAGIADLFDRVSDVYDNVDVDYFSTFGRRLVELTRITPGERVLDVGCGAGAATLAAAEAVGASGRVTAIDLAPGMVARTEAALAERQVDWVDVYLGDAQAPEVPGPYDAIVCSLVLFFLPDQAAALSAYHGLLADGGRLGVTTFPDQPESGWNDVLRVLDRYVPAGAPKPDKGPLTSAESFETVLREVGFADVVSTTEAHETAFRDVDHWWSWAWSHGQRFALERIPADQADDVRAELAALVASMAAPDGRIPLRQLITYTVASR